MKKVKSPISEVVAELKLADLQRTVQRLKRENLQMRTDMGVLIEFPDGKAAKQIQLRYKLKSITIKRESLANKN